MAEQTDPGAQGAEHRPDQTQPNPAGHERGNQRPEGMSDVQWEALRDLENAQRKANRINEFINKFGRPPGPGDDLDDLDSDAPSEPDPSTTNQ